jgi:hypothetical protein
VPDETALSESAYELDEPVENLSLLVGESWNSPGAWPPEEVLKFMMCSSAVGELRVTVTHASMEIPAHEECLDTASALIASLEPSKVTAELGSEVRLEDLSVGDPM